MNKYQKVLSPFLGGAIGILLSGYFYYATNEQNYWLLPLGVLIGSSLGYFLGNIKNIIKETSQHRKRLIEKTSENWRLFTFVFQTIKKKVSSKLKANLSFVFVKKFFVSTQKKYKNFVKVMSHPVTKSLLLRTLLSILVLGGISYFYISFITSKLGGSNEDSGILGFFASCSIIGIILQIMFPVARCTRTYESQSNFFREYEKFGDKFKLISENIKSDITIFVWVQMIIVSTLSVFLLGMGYLIMLGVPVMIIAALSIIVIEYLSALKKYSVATTFATTFVITAISYMAFNAYFSNQIIIWFTALATGTISVLASIKATEILSKRNLVSSDKILDYLMEKILFVIPGWLFRKVDPVIQKLPHPSLWGM